MMQQPSPGAPNSQAPPQYQHQPMRAPPPPQYQYQHQHQHQQWMMMQPQQPQPVQLPPVGWMPQPVHPPMPAQMEHYPGSHGSAGSGEIKSLWIGDLQPHMDADYLRGFFAETGEVVSAKVIKNKQTGHSEGYGFIEFVSRAAAEKILQNYNGSLMPNSDQSLRMNWATLGAGEKRQEEGHEYAIFVGDLAADVSDYLLQETFRAVYNSVKSAKVVTDRMTGRSKGYGFVKFSDEGEQLRALSEMNGVVISSRPMRVGPAANKRSMGGEHYQSASNQNASVNQGENDPNNTTIFVGALDPNVTDEELTQVFGQFGELHSVKIPAGKRCGFVQFVSRASAEKALLMLNGTQLGGQNIRLSWGRGPSNKQSQPEQTHTQWSGGYYGYLQQVYEGYGYPQPPQDPNMFYGGAGYGGYNYQQAATYQQQPQR